jgi:hypothetical protein
MKRPSRKPPAFVRCPTCGTEFRNFADQRWCSVECRHARAAAAKPEAATDTVRTRKRAKHAAADAVSRVRNP